MHLCCIMLSCVMVFLLLFKGIPTQSLFENFPIPRKLTENSILKILLGQAILIFGEEIRVIPFVKTS